MTEGRVVKWGACVVIFGGCGGVGVRMIITNSKINFVKEGGDYGLFLLI